MSAAMSLVVGVWVVFCVVVSPVLGASIPVESKLVLRGPAAEPPKTHIHHLAPTRNNTIVLLTTPAAVELSVWMGLLGWGHPISMRVWQCGIIFACSDEEGSKFQFGSGCHNKFDNLGNGEDRAIEAWVGNILQEKDMSSSLAPRLQLIKEASIRVST
jgi:hypothetical protein